MIATAVRLLITNELSFGSIPETARLVQLLMMSLLVH